MEFEGKYLLEGSPEAVWDALHETALLTRCVPGCKAIRWIGEDMLEAEIELRAGRSRRSYRGHVQIADAVPPRSYRLLFGETGQGNSVSAAIELAGGGGRTCLSYRVEAQLDGHLARLGTPVVRAVARGIARRFFRRLNAELGAQ